mmetsp:Transcript_3403/g.7047  ORF Transcript_3403/g.7047 Transcript_3403/m.7047 type:complete len:86 (+) Transcript_3403:380-637(+)
MKESFQILGSRFSFLADLLENRQVTASIGRQVVERMMGRGGVETKKVAVDLAAIEDLNPAGYHASRSTACNYIYFRVVCKLETSG